MAKEVKSWRDRFCSTKEGVCEFLPNYRFYFKWLTGLFASCIIVRGRTKTRTIDKEYMKKTLILEGCACITDFSEKLYACCGSIGGEPDEYYIPTNFIIANPVLGSKVVHWRDFKQKKKNGVLICNTDIDRFCVNTAVCGFYDLIHQTATLLADNLVSISCAQINSRVQNFVLAKSDTQAETGEVALKKLYSGKPFTVLQSDIMENIEIMPAFSGSPSHSLTELVELNNYILSDFLKKIGVCANVTMKRERLITDEVTAQNDFVALSLTELIGSWQRGFDEVNELYPELIEEPFAVSVNPAIVKTLLDLFAPAEPEGVGTDAEQPEDNPEPASEEPPAETPEEGEDSEAEAETEADEQPAENEAADIADELEEQAEAVEEISEALIGEGGEDRAADDESEGLAEPRDTE